MTDWKEITDPEELFRLKREGWEIELANGTSWGLWAGTIWSAVYKFRARPPQPKTKKVKMLCWFDGTWLQYATEDHSKGLASATKWIRIPAEDKEIEVQDDN